MSEPKRLTPGTIEADFAGDERLNLDNFLFSLVPSFDEALFRRFVSGELVTSGDNAFIFGGPGTGKTFLSYCLARACAQQGKTVRVLTEGDTHFSEANDFAAGLISHGRTRPVREDLIHCDLLVVNEFGRTCRREDERLSELLKIRFADRRSTVIVTTHNPYRVVTENMLSLAGYQYPITDPGMELSNPFSTARLLVDLHIGIYWRCYSLQPLIKRLRVPDEPFQQAIFKHLGLARLSWLKAEDRKSWFRLEEPLREWQLFDLGDQNFRHRPDWAVEQAKAAKAK